MKNNNDEFNTNSDGSSPEKPKMATSTKAFIITLTSIVLAVAIFFGVRYANGKTEAPNGTGEQLNQNPGEGSDGEPEDETIEGLTYPVSFNNPAAGAEDVVLMLDGVELNNMQVSYFYWEEFHNLVQYYGEMIYYIVDPGYAMDLQSYSDSNTWHDVLLESGIRSAIQMHAILELATEAGFTLPEEAAQGIEDYFNDISENPGNYGYSSLDDLLLDYFGAYASEETYRAYLYDLELTRAYLDKLYLDFYEERKDDPVEDIATVDVRHILISADDFTSLTDNVDLTADTAVGLAEEIYALWQENPTEEEFARMAAEYSQDPGSIETGGLYEGVVPGMMIAEFNDWCFDPARKAGDSGIVETSYGYHIMFYSGDGVPQPGSIDEEISLAFYEWRMELIDSVAYEVNYDNVNIGGDLFSRFATDENFDGLEGNIDDGHDHDVTDGEDAEGVEDAEGAEDAESTESTDESEDAGDTGEGEEETEDTEKKTDE